MAIQRAGPIIVYFPCFDGFFLDYFIVITGACKQHSDVADVNQGGAYFNLISHCLVC